MPNIYIYNVDKFMRKTRAKKSYQILGSIKLLKKMNVPKNRGVTMNEITLPNGVDNVYNLNIFDLYYFSS